MLSYRVLWLIAPSKFMIMIWQYGDWRYKIDHNIRHLSIELSPRLPEAHPLIRRSNCAIFILVKIQNHNFYLPVKITRYTNIADVLQRFPNRYGVPDDFPTLRDMDVFGRTIHEMFYSVTARGINYITLPQFDEICASKKYNFGMRDEEKRGLIKGIIK